MPTPAIPKTHLFQTLFSSDYLPTWKERKRSSDLCKFPSDQKTLQTDLTAGLAGINFELKIHGNSLIFSLHFVMLFFQ